MPNHPNRLQRVPHAPRGDAPRSFYAKQSAARHPVKMPSAYVADVAELERELLPRSFRDFVPRAFPYIEKSEQYVHGTHVDVVCEHLQACADGQIPRLIINIPPGHMKSILASVAFPAWVWSRQQARYREACNLSGPHARFIFTSYSDDFVKRDSLKTQALIESPWYQERWPLGLELANTTEFVNEKGGWRLGVGTGGGVTGKHTHWAIADDPLKAQEAHSKAAREAAVRFWQETMTTRMLPGACRIVVMQRLHQDDLTGFLVKEGGYELLMLPEAFEKKRACVTVLGLADKREKEGDLLWKERFPESAHKVRAKELGSFGNAGQLQQRPAPEEGGIVKRAVLKRWNAASLPPMFDLIWQSWDLTLKNTNDYVAGGLFGSSGPNVYLLKVTHALLSFTQMIESINLMREASAGKPPYIIIEDAAAGAPAEDTLRLDGVDGIILMRPEGSKVMRLHAIVPFLEAGNFYIPEAQSEDPADPINAYVDELTTFPNATHDDQVDMTTQAVLWWRKHRADSYTSMELPGGERESPNVFSF